MRKMISIAAVILLTAAAGLPVAAGASGERKTPYEVCRERATAMKFGIHFIRKDRWIRRCLRGDV